MAPGADLEGLTLVVLAAGLARRYGRLKQLEAVGPGGEAIMDYGVHDAVRAGFERVVVIVRPETERAFNAHAAEYWPDVARHFTHQLVSEVPAGYEVPAGRSKPWGTAHALLSASAELGGPFAVMNADDFYGAGSYALLARHLGEQGPESESALIGFRLGGTLSEHGGVSRAVCEVVDGRLVGLTEYTEVRRTATGIVGDGVGERVRRLDPAALVSMNLWGFTPRLLPALESGFSRFLEERSGDVEAEYLLPDAVSALVRRGAQRVRVLESEGPWMGLTHPEDRPTTATGIRRLVEAGVYPARLSGQWPQTTG